MPSTVTKILSAFLMLALVGLAAPGAHAQGQLDETDASLKLGVRGGLMQTSLQGNGVLASEDRSDYIVGLFFTLDTGEIVSLQAEANYSTQGSAEAQVRRPGLADTVPLEYNLLQFPVLLKAGIPLGGITPRVLAGPAFGVVLNPELNGQDVSGDFTRGEFSAVIGGELAFPVGTFADEFAVDARYNIGISDIAGDTGGFEKGIRGESFAGTLSLRFDL